MVPLRVFSNHSMKTKSVSSSVFQKFVMGISGLLLVGFVITHLSGNFFLLQKEGSLFNAYAHKLESLGPLLYAAEVGLIVFFLTHAFTGIRLAIRARAAKPMKYVGAQTKGGKSKWGMASNNMAITGSLLFVFLILHVIHFKFGPGMAEGYVTKLSDGVETRDLHRHVVEQFKNPVMVALYVGVMLALAIHLRHGVWSALQSLGLTRENNSKALYLVGGALGVLIGVGFLFIPIFIYFFL